MQDAACSGRLLRGLYVWAVALVGGPTQRRPLEGPRISSMSVPCNRGYDYPTAVPWAVADRGGCVVRVVPETQSP